MKVVGVIPARFASTRFPGKPLFPLLGKPMIRWVYERASRAQALEKVLVATDDERIYLAVEAFGGRAVMTSRDCPTGSDRVWEAVRDLDCEVVLNIQGDEPALDTSGVQALARMMLDDPSLAMGTLVAPLERQEEYSNPNVVKVALGQEGRCLYFSRSPIPFLRGAGFGVAPLYRHVGIYAFRKRFLGEYTHWPQGRLEVAEALEQLRPLERGVAIRAAVVSWPGCGVDSPQDVPAAEAILRALGENDAET